MNWRLIPLAVMAGTAIGVLLLALVESLRASLREGWMRRPLTASELDVLAAVWDLRGGQADLETLAAWLRDIYSWHPEAAALAPLFVARLLDRGLVGWPHRSRSTVEITRRGRRQLRAKPDRSQRDGARGSLTRTR